ncbi:MAG: M28 family peptidase [Promethearchaeota archaeon]|nr:MAG: M28 family peptidase [Candidatus Lokiarchaeota archaeon]
MINIIKEKEDGLNHIKALAFDRSASSIGETEAITYIENELSSHGINSKRDYFTWTSTIAILLRLGYLLVLINLIMLRQILIIILFFFSKNLFQKTRKLSLIPKENSKNLLTFINSKKKENEKPLMIFTAHYDSVSAIISYKYQKIIFMFYKIVTAIYVGVILFFLFDFFFGFIDPLENFQIFLFVNITLSILAIFITGPLLIIVLKEIPSSGSIDNASGVAVLIELAKHFSINPPKNIDILFLWTGAEEGGLRGSKHFCEKYYDQLKEKYDLNRSYLINIDMVGSYIGLIRKTGLFQIKINKNLNQIINHSAQKLNIKIKNYSKLLNPDSDHRSFKKFVRKTKKNFQISFIHSDEDSKFIHSSQDTPDKCSSEIINDCIKVCFQTVKAIDHQLDIKKELI